jgi:ERCC4-type nuclease
MKSTPRTAQSINKQIVDYKLKAPVFPSDMIILQDTREQIPLFGQRLPKGMVLCSETLKFGDYSLRGFAESFAIERKGISDLLSYCTTEREKTKRKMEQFKKMEWVGLVVECRESELYRPYIHSSISPELIRQCLVSFSIRYGVHVYVNQRENIVRWTLDHMIKFWKIKHEL